MKKIVLSAVAVSLLATCTDRKQKNEATASIDSTTKVVLTSPVVGDDKDEHGCIGSAGYQWSVLKNKCLRAFEEADAKLLPAKAAATYTSSAIVLFNDDQSKAELYMPNQTKSLILDRAGKEGGYIWKNDSLELFAWKGYALRKNGTVIFHGE